MLYVAYLDEFGHIGPYLSHDDPSHKMHPVFGIGGVVLPYTKIRDFSTFFYQLKNNLLDFELQKANVHPAQWEKKGASLYTLTNLKRYPELRRATFRLLNKIKELDGFIIHVGIEKRRSVENHDSKEVYHTVMREVLKRLDEECSTQNAKLMIILDQQEKNVMRPEIIKRAGIAMFGQMSIKSLLEPPLEAESHLYQTLQTADWLCGIFGRLAKYQTEPKISANYQLFEQYFGQRLKVAAKRSGLRRIT